MEEKQTKIDRVRRIPAVVNWARQNNKRTDQTRDNLKRLADNPFMTSLRSTYRLCTQLALREIEIEKALEKIGAYKGFSKSAGKAIVPVFKKYIDQKNIRAIPEFKSQNWPYLLGRDSTDTPISIPVRPDFVYENNGKLVPTFLIGWADRPLSTFQKSLMSWVIYDSILTLEDFLDSDGLILTFPKKTKYAREREPVTWWVKSYLNIDRRAFDINLDKEQFDLQVQLYMRAVEQAVQMIRDE